MTMNNNGFYSNERQNQPVQQPYVPYQSQYTQYGGGQGGGEQGPPKKKGVAGVVIACTLSAALIGGVVGGVGGVAMGYNIAPKIDRQMIADMVAEAIPEAASFSPGETRPTAQPVASVDTALTISEIAEKLSPSVVAIDSTVSQPYNTPFGTFQSEGTGSGSGVIISTDGYIVTNNHVIEGATSITVYLSDGTEYKATLIGRDPETDIAVIKIDAQGLSAAELGVSGDLKVGDIAIAIGNPLGNLAGSVTQGIISATERAITIENTKLNVLQFDAAINQGNSGGALVNGKGQLVGIVNAKSFAVGVEGLGFAIPIDDVREIIDAIVSGVPLGTGEAKLGVTTRTVTPEVSQAYGLPIGAYVVEVEEFSSAERAGIRPGDVITSFGGQKITSGEELTAVRDQHEIGDVLQMTVSREGREIELEITLTEGVKTF